MAGLQRDPEALSCLSASARAPICAAARSTFGVCYIEGGVILSAGCLLACCATTFSAGCVVDCYVCRYSTYNVCRCWWVGGLAGGNERAAGRLAGRPAAVFRSRVAVSQRGPDWTYYYATGKGLCVCVCVCLVRSLSLLVSRPHVYLVYALQASGAAGRPTRLHRAEPSAPNIGRLGGRGEKARLGGLFILSVSAAAVEKVPFFVQPAAGVVRCCPISALIRG